MTGEELYDRYGKDVLGPWDDQEPSVQRAWEDLAASVNIMGSIQQAAAHHLLGEPPYEP